MLVLNPRGKEHLVPGQEIPTTTAVLIVTVLLKGSFCGHGKISSYPWNLLRNSLLTTENKLSISKLSLTRPLLYRRQIKPCNSREGVERFQRNIWEHLQRTTLTTIQTNEHTESVHVIKTFPLIYPNISLPWSHLSQREYKLIIVNSKHHIYKVADKRTSFV